LHNKYLICLLTVISVIILDQWSKIYISSALPLYNSRAIIEGLLSITHVMNKGAAFGFLAQATPLFRAIFFMLVTIAAIILIFYYMLKSRADQPGLVFALSLILGGALGNMIDRLRFGAVVDFVDVYWKTYHWPAFNVADSAISLGAVLMIVEMWKRRKDEGGET